MTDAVLDLLVVGAGPAGTAAALTAHDLGLAVKVLDRARFPRDKTCGDGLTTNALRVLEHLGLDLDALTGDGGYIPVRDVVIVGPDGRRIDLPLPDAGGEYAGVVSRSVLDQALVDLALERGVPLVQGAEVIALSEEDHHVVVRTADGSEHRARAVVAADGHFSTVRRLVQPDRGFDLGEWHAVRQYHANVHTDRLWVVFEEDLLPGYAWVFPLPDGRANVGFGVLRADGRSGREHKALWANLLERPVLREILGPDAVPVERTRAWPIPTRQDATDLVHGRILFAGDAAGVVDPMTGEGIAQALETGIFAARAVAQTAGPRDAATRYQLLVRRALGRDLRFAARLGRVLARPLGARAALAAVDLNDWTRRNFARWMFEDYPRAIVLTPDRWRPGVLTGPGAYRGR